MISQPFGIEGPGGLSDWIRMYPRPVREVSVINIVWSFGSKWVRHCGQVMIDLTLSIEAVCSLFHTKAFFFFNNPFIGSTACLRSGIKSKN